MVGMKNVCTMVKAASLENSDGCCMLQAQEIGLNELTEQTQHSESAPSDEALQHEFSRFYLDVAFEFDNGKDDVREERHERDQQKRSHERQGL